MRNQVHTWKMTTVTPVHIGDGDELHQNLDFVQDKYRNLEVLDVEAILNQLAAHPKAIQEFGGHSFNLEKFLRDYKLGKRLLYNLPFSGGKPPASMRRAIKDAFHRPYIPGSSLKGSLRTVLWKHGLQRRLPHVRDFKKFNKDVQQVSGTSPHEDFLRPLYVSDSAPVAAGDVLQAEDVKYFNLQTGNKPSWKDFSTRKNVQDHGQALGVVVEAIKPDQSMVVQTNLVSFLGHGDVRKAANIPKCSGLEDVHSLCQMVNRHTLELVNRELDYFSEYKPVTGPVVAFYENLQKKILELAQTSGSCILRLAWGSGWKGMTGDWMDETTLQGVRKEKRLGREGFPFPKTRRLAVKDGQPCLPLGWILLELDDQLADVFYGSSALPEEISMGQETSDTGGDTKASYSAASPAKSDEENRQETIEQFKLVLEKEQSGLSGKIDFLIEKIEAQEDLETQKIMCAELIKVARKGKNFKKAKNAQKAWVVKIQELAGKLDVEM